LDIVSDGTEIPVGTEKKVGTLRGKTHYMMTCDFVEGREYQGFRLLKRKFIKEVNGWCLYFTHIRSGARLFKIMADDSNKTFCIGFKTLPDSDNGAPHIMEHSVLNGSEKFPVKSPFDVLLKGSLSTFLNAFTSKDYTMYPVASMNDKDYFNLMHVYLDAVFKPLIYSDDRIFKQEGWRHELTGPDGELIYSGVVYNEMKGAFSNPQRELWYQVFRHLFPGHPYGFESGGHPASIPGLTAGEFIDFHRKYYHPGNSYIFLYGDADLLRELAFIDESYLSGYSGKALEFHIPDQDPYPARKEITEYYPLTEGASPLNQTFLTYNFLAGQNSDLALTMALDILCEVLVNQESAPVRKALQEAGIGQEVSATCSNFKQHAVQIAALNANPGDKQRFHEIITQTLTEVIGKGLDKEVIRGVINRMEFRLREGDDAQKGLACLNQCLARWFFCDDPFSGLEYEAILREVKRSLTENYLEILIERYFLDPTRLLLLTLEPSPGLDKLREAGEVRVLESYRSSLTPAAIDDLINENRDLTAFQQREDSAEALATIPMLTIGDIRKQADPIHFVQEEIGGLRVIQYSQFCNGVVYLNLGFDLQVIPEELIPYAALLANLAGSLDTSEYSFEEINNLLNIHSGGFSTTLRSYNRDQEDDCLLPYFMVSAKTMQGQSEKMFGLATEILLNTRYRDMQRMKTLIARHQSHLDAWIKGSGFQIANKRLTSYFSRQGLFGELTGGWSYYRFVTGILNDFDAVCESLSDRLEQTARLLFTRENLIVAVTCDEQDKPDYYEHLTRFIGMLPVIEPVRVAWNLRPEIRNEGLMAASNVQYVTSGFNFRKLGYSWSGRLLVLNQVLSTDWLQTQVRVVGGAYGGFSSIAPSGNFTFNSYRDPNLAETLNVYRKTPDFLEKFNPDMAEMTRFIIGTIAEIDTPLTPSQKGNKALSMALTRRTNDDRQREREEVLSTEPGHIRDLAEMVRNVVGQGVLCVYGSAEKLTKEKKLFGELVPVHS